jgi:hypothetical protein
VLRRRDVSWRRFGAFNDRFVRTSTPWDLPPLIKTPEYRTGISLEIDCILMEEERDYLNNFEAFQESKDTTRVGR